MESLALIVSGTQRLVETVEFFELFFDGLDVFEEFVEVYAGGGTSGAHLDVLLVVVAGRGGFLATEAREGAGKLVVHFVPFFFFFLCLKPNTVLGNGKVDIGFGKVERE